MTRQRRGAWESKSCVSSAFFFFNKGLRGVERVAEDAARKRVMVLFRISVKYRMCSLSLCSYTRSSHRRL
jgi:hypothetical protein